VWALALSLTFFGGYAALTDLGVEGAAVRYIAEARAEGDPEAVNRIVSSAFAFFSFAALVITPPLVLLAPWFVHLFSVDPLYQRPATYAFSFVAAQLVFDLPARAFFAALEGSQQSAMYQAVLLIRALVQAALFVAVLVADLGIGSLGAVSLISSAVMFVAAWLLARRAVPELRLSRGRVSRSVMRSLFVFGGGLFLIRIVGTLYQNMDKVIVGIALGPTSVAIYQIANQLHLAVALVQSVSASAILPATAYLRQHAEILRDMFLRGTAYTVALSMPVVVAAFVFAGPLIRTWLGSSLSAAIGPSRLFLVYLSFVVFNAVGATMVVALGRLRFVGIVAAANLAVNLALSIALVHPLGVEGVILGTLIAQALAWPVLLWFFLRTFGVAIAEWARRVVPPVVPGFAVQAVTALPLLYLADRATNVAEVGALALVSCGGGVAASFLFGFAKAQREALVTILRQAVGLRAAT
jgi:O-antigen/teichoic acid export membrane protein